MWCLRLEYNYGPTRRPRQTSPRATDDTTIECDLKIKPDPISRKELLICLQLWNSILIDKHIDDRRFKTLNNFP